MHPKNWTQVDRNGVCISPGRFYVDPERAVALAVITHGHADHARRGHGTVVATPETLAIMQCRYGRNFCEKSIPLGIHESMQIGQACITFFPAGHVLGSVQVQVEYDGQRLGVSGDYKCGGGDPTCADWEPVPCEVFLTEATFAYPLFVFPDPFAELTKLLRSMHLFPDRPHLVAAYSLGKAQRVIASLRVLGFEETIYAHASVCDLNEVYSHFGIELGSVKPLEQYEWNESSKQADVIVSPQGAKLGWRLPETIQLVCAGASGWNSVRKHAKSAGLEVPMVISDHCDWPGLQRSILETGAREIWVTHGPGDALKHWGRGAGLRILGLKEVWSG